MTEAPDSEKVGIEIPGDGGEFRRLCAKMATGTGKTVVMAMVIAWHILNKVGLSPGHPLRQERAGGCPPASPSRTASPFWNRPTLKTTTRLSDVCPRPLLDRLRQGKVIVRNWHALNWETEEQIGKKRSVDKRGAKSDEAYVRDVLGDMAGAIETCWSSTTKRTTLGAFLPSPK